MALIFETVVKLKNKEMARLKTNELGESEFVPHEMEFDLLELYEGEVKVATFRYHEPATLAAHTPIRWDMRWRK